MSRRGIVPTQLQSYRDDWHMSPGVSSNGLIFLTGMTGTRDDGSIARDVEQQIRDAFEKVRLVLNEAGYDLSAVVEMTSYHVGIRDHIDVFRAVRDEHLGEPYPAWTAIEVSGFISPEAVVELRVVAEADRT
jgi:enamine deaminase RidA (YjgF/YER057c/UK114 family)